MKVIGLIADTHVPDRRPALHPEVTTIFQKAEVDLILHAGDVSTPDILDQLGNIAPVFAVKGNRDFLFLRNLPKTYSLTCDHRKIGVAHGHENLFRYILGKILYPVNGPPFEYYRPYLERTFSEAQIIIFGHVHFPVNRWINGQLFFNPGSAATPSAPFPPSVGILTLEENSISARHVRLERYSKKQWRHQ